jgi:hypothetical protein
MRSAPLRRRTLARVPVALAPFDARVIKEFFAPVAPLVVTPVAPFGSLAPPFSSRLELLLLLVRQESFELAARLRAHPGDFFPEAGDLQRRKSDRGRIRPLGSRQIAKLANRAAERFKLRSGGIARSFPNGSRPFPLFGGEPGRFASGHGTRAEKRRQGQGDEPPTRKKRCSHCHRVWPSRAEEH